MQRTGALTSMHTQTSRRILHLDTSWYRNMICSLFFHVAAGLLVWIAGCRAQGDKHFVMPAGNPVADPAAVVVEDSARFTVLTSSLIRCEYALPGDQFEDRQTVVVFNRRLRVPEFSVSKLAEGGIQIDTSSLTLQYLGGRFSSETLSIKLKTPNLLNVTRWRYGESS